MYDRTDINKSFRDEKKKKKNFWDETFGVSSFHKSTKPGPINRIKALYKNLI